MCSLSTTMIGRQHAVSSVQGVRIRHSSSANKHVIRLRRQEEESAHVQPVCGLFVSEQEVDQVAFVFLVSDMFIEWNSVPTESLLGSSVLFFQSFPSLPSLPRMNNNGNLGVYPNPPISVSAFLQNTNKHGNYTMCSVQQEYQTEAHLRYEGVTENT